MEDNILPTGKEDETKQNYAIRLDLNSYRINSIHTSTEDQFKLFI